MASLRWFADGIEVAERAGGVTLDRARGVGFAGSGEVHRRPAGDLAVSGFDIAVDPDPFDIAVDPDPFDDEDRRDPGG